MTVSPQNRGFSEFFAISGCDTHFKSELRKMAGDGPGQPAYYMFTMERTFLRILSFDLLKSKSLAYGGLKFQYSFKMH